jgi:hypothetical protein
LIPAGFVFTLLLLPALSIIWPAAMWIWISFLGLYFGANLLVSMLTAALKGWNLIPLLPYIFAIFHFAYGWGFLRGLTDFVMRRGSHNFYTAPTRASHDDVVREP